MGFGIKEEFLNDSNRIAAAKALADRKAKEAIGEFIASEWTGEKITIEEGEWEKEKPDIDSPDITPFTKHFYIKKEDK